MMTSLVQTCSLCLLIGLAATARAADDKKDPVAPERADKIRLLIVTGGHEFEREAFFEMFSGHPDITWKEVVQPDAQQWFSPDKANQYDVMVWYDLFQDISEQAKTDLVKVLKSGKPLLALHHSVANYQDWPEALKIIGGKYHLHARGDKTGSTFKHDADMKVKIVDPDHPITRFMNHYEIHDETYKFMEFLPGVKPLLKTDHPDSDELVGWTHTYGKAKVVYLQGGHDSKAYQNPNYRRLIAQSVRYLAGRLPDPSEKGFKPLLDGKDFAGWEIVGDPAGYKMLPDGVLRSDLPYKGEWMHTRKLYSDFVLRVQWRVSEGGNSGVFVRSLADSEGHPWITGTEVQITNAPRDIAHCTGSLYGTVPVDPRPDESANVWHEFQIECRGPEYKVFVDNVPVVDIDARRVPALYAKPLIGYIGLQDNHAEQGFIEYRNVRVKELKMVDGDPTAWRLGTQTYTFRLFTLFEAIDKAKALGLDYVEAFPGQGLSRQKSDVHFSHHAPVEVLDEVKRKLAETGIAMQCYGVINNLGGNETETRKVFEFARLMGIDTINAEPALDGYEMLDRMTKEYDINVAVHNHPRRADHPDYIYWNPEEVLELVKSCNTRVGLCGDTGHWLRSGLDPVECLKKAEGRLISLHLKDLNKKALDAHDVVWGQGVADMSAILEELERQEFAGPISVEYEHNWENSMPEIAQCIKFFRSKAAELNVDKTKSSR